MSITKRQEQILELLNENRFLSVEKLSRLTYASASSIRRDLTALQNLCLVRRTHGGATVPDETDRVAPYGNRLTQNALGKKKIAKKAATLLCDGQTVLLDGSSTVAFLIPYLAKRNGITLFTNNIETALSAIRYGIDTHCLGGQSLNGSAALSGAQSCRAVCELYPDICFFSSHSLDSDGVISDPCEEENYLRSLMISRAKQRVFLCDGEKFNRRSLHVLTTLDELSAAVFDIPYDGLKSDCKIL